MKVSEIPYKRYTIEEAQKAFSRFRSAVEAAKNADEVIEARKLMLDILCEYSTAASLANCRFTLNTRDPFYQAEMEYYDEKGPLFNQLNVEYADLMLASPYRAELEQKLNPQLFKTWICNKKAFSPDIIAESQEENAIVTEYSKFMSEMTFSFDGKTLPLSVVRGYLEDTDRDVRRRAAEAIGKGLQAHAAALDDIYDRLVKIRDKQAKKMGYKSFVELGYYRMGRTDYDADMVARFRENVCRSLVPVVSALKKKIAGELGIDRMMFYDDAVCGKGASPRPIVDAEELFNRAQKMYDDMDPEIGAFMRKMRENEAFDTLARDGKWGGGYCTSFPKYDQPFILANFNGSSGDVDVITHEFGHALANSFIRRFGDFELNVGSMETAECHSMSMEFLCWKDTEAFFGDQADTYRKKHLTDALSFIPYGVIVDEYQHIIYSHPEMTPAERKAAYLELEKKYRPYLSFDGIPYLEEGTRWQYQMHIYESPFYYIDYCLAQTVAIHFLVRSRENYDEALHTYLAFARKGGTQPFSQLVREAGIPSPFEDGSLDDLAQKALGIINSL